jgi:hypothetical protein
MEKHGLLKCGQYGKGGSHYWSQTYDEIPDNTRNMYGARYDNHQLKTNPPTICPVCKYTYVYKVIEHRPGLIASRFVVRTFEGIYNSVDSYLSAPKDSILLELESAGFIPDRKASNDGHLVYISPEGYKAVFRGMSRHRKTHTLILITLPKHGLIKKIDVANKKDKKVKQAANPSQSKIDRPDFVRDFLGSKLVVGDWIAYTYGTILGTGKIIRFTNKTVSIMPHGGKKIVSGKSFKQIVKLPNEQAMLLQLSV